MIKNINHVFAFLLLNTHFFSSKRTNLNERVWSKLNFCLSLLFYRNVVEAEISVVKMAPAECTVNTHHRRHRWATGRR